MSTMDVDEARLEQFMGPDDRVHDRRGSLLRDLARRRAWPVLGIERQPWQRRSVGGRRWLQPAVGARMARRAGRCRVGRLRPERAGEAGVEDRTTFEVAAAKQYEGSYDLICFDCLHDMGDPVGVAAYAREHLEPGGTVLLVEPFALDGRATNQANNPMAPLLYMASTVVCTPNSLSQEVGLGLGAQAGEARLRAVFEEAGFSHFRKATETPLNLILGARA
jgi:Methyltransferase domain